MSDDIIHLDTGAEALLQKLSERHRQESTTAEPGEDVELDAADDSVELDAGEDVDNLDGESEPVEPEEQAPADLVTIEIGEEAYELPQSVVDHIKAQVPAGQISDDDRKVLETAQTVTKQYADTLQAIADVTPEPKEPDYAAILAEVRAGRLDQTAIAEAQIDFQQKSQAFRQMREELATARQNQYQQQLKQRDSVLTDPSAGIKGWDDPDLRKAEIERDMKLAARFGVDDQAYRSIADPRFHRLVNHAAALEERLAKQPASSKKTVRAISSKGARQPVRTAQKQRNARADFAKHVESGATDLEALLNAARAARS